MKSDTSRENSPTIVAAMTVVDELMMVWCLLGFKASATMECSLKTEMMPAFWIFVVTGGTAGCDNDNRCRSWQHYWHHDNAQFSFNILSLSQLMVVIDGDLVPSWCQGISNCGMLSLWMGWWEHHINPDVTVAAPLTCRISYIRMYKMITVTRLTFVSFAYATWIFYSNSLKPGYVSGERVIICSGGGLSPLRHQVIIRTNAKFRLLSTGHLAIKFRENGVRYEHFTSQHCISDNLVCKMVAVLVGPGCVNKSLPIIRREH